MSLKIPQREIEIEEVPEKYLPLLDTVHNAIEEVKGLLSKSEKLLAQLEMIQEQAEDIVIAEAEYKYSKFY